MDPVFNDLVSANIPLGHVLTGIAVLGMLFVLVKKIATGIAAVGSKISLAFGSAFLMFALGAGGIGLSGGDLALHTFNGEEPQVKQESPQGLVFTNGDLINLAMNEAVDDNKLHYILNYAKERDINFLEKGGIDLATLCQLPGTFEPIPAPQEVVESEEETAQVTAAPEDEQKPLMPLPLSTGTLGLSLALLISSIVTFLYRVSP